MRAEAWRSRRPAAPPSCARPRAPSPRARPPPAAAPSSAAPPGSASTRRAPSAGHPPRDAAARSRGRAHRHTSSAQLVCRPSIQGRLGGVASPSSSARPRCHSLSCLSGRRATPCSVLCVSSARLQNPGFFENLTAHDSVSLFLVTTLTPFPLRFFPLLVLQSQRCSLHSILIKLHLPLPSARRF